VTDGHLAISQAESSSHLGFDNSQAAPSAGDWNDLEEVAMYSSHIAEEMARGRISDWRRAADKNRPAAAVRPGRPPRNPRMRIRAIVHARFPCAITRRAAA
jgi:hypothetical protein